MNEVSNPSGRPKGSKNQITILKLAMESGVRSQNVEQIGRILKGILDDAEAGDRDCRKMVWQSVMSRAGSETGTSTGDAPQITLRVEGNPRIESINVIDVQPEAVKEIEYVEAVPDLGQSPEGPRPVNAEVSVDVGGKRPRKGRKPAGPKSP
jgi:hypothetical protein